MTPPTRFAQSVRLSLKSYDIDDTVVTNFDHFFTFMADFELHKLDPEFILYPDHPSQIKLVGFNFNQSHNYTLVLTDVFSDIKIDQFTYPAKFELDILLTVDIAGIKTKRNRKLRAELKVEGND